MSKKETLRQKLKKDAAFTLERMVEDAHKQLQKVVHATPIRSVTIAALVAGGRVETIRKHCINKLAASAEAELLNLYEGQKKESAE